MAKDHIIKLLTILNLPQIGMARAKKILGTADFSLHDNLDFEEKIVETIVRLKLPIPTKAGLETALDIAFKVLEESGKNNIHLISYLDERYPQNLLLTPDYPLLLHYKGYFEGLAKNPSLGFIGTRTPTSLGQEYGQRVAKIFSSEGFNIISGLALGCDTIGHNASVENSSFTAAVLAHGLDMVFPKENTPLSEKILSGGGLLLSEYSIGVKPRSEYFVARNRIQAGLSDGLFVLETEVKSGTMHTVNFAAKYKRPISAFNHPVKYHGQPKAEGNQVLIKKGQAIPIYSKDDLLGFYALIKSMQVPRLNNSIGQEPSNDINSSSQLKIGF